MKVIFIHVGSIRPLRIELFMYENITGNNFDSILIKHWF